MRAVVQRVLSATVRVNQEIVSGIGMGLCCLIGVEAHDGPGDIDYIAQKICSLRIFDDEKGLMNLDAAQVEGDILLVSQFTLLGDARKGRRPSYTCAEQPQAAGKTFEGLVSKVKGLYTGTVRTGQFQAMMDVELVNHGPVTILLDSRKLL